MRTTLDRAMRTVLFVAMLASLVLSVGTFTTSLVTAEEDESPTSVSNDSPSVSNNSPSVSNNSVRLTNPLKSDDIKAFLVSIIEVLVIFAIPIIVLFIMYAGFLFVTAKGDTSKIEDAKRALLWSVVGGVIVLGAQLIVTVIQGTVEPLLR